MPKLIKRKLALVYEFQTRQISDQGKHRDKKGLYRITKRSILQEGIIILHLYIHGNKGAKYIRQDLKECQEKYMNPLL